ncbi:MAG: amidohydrolase family protein, partial [Proteobacteria bacterium]|nr:amidohydrolase family protein [Pseudomonadota bacterium]
SVDDHVVEPPDMFKNHIPASYADRAPRMVRKADGSDMWLFEGQQLPNIGLNAVAGRPPEEYGVEPTAFAQMRPGCYDIHERIRDMNANGVLASMCFPSFPSFCGALWARQEDKELARVMLQAYNDWHVDEWCGSYPGRFIPLSLPALWDPKLAADEVRRMAKKGCHAVSFTENPEKVGFPSLHNEYWDPFWEACADQGTVVCIHIGSASGMSFTTMDSPVDVMITVSPINIVSCAADLLWSQVLRRYPTLKFALSEGGIGWIPYFLERADYVYKNHHRWTHQDFGNKLPSDVFREHIITCFIDDPVGVKNRHAVGIETITWECDYPHSDTTWPKAPEILSRSLDGVPDDEINQMTHENALREFRLDVFAERPREKCTVGALRAEATDVDLSLLETGGGTPPSDNPRPVTAQDITMQLAQIYATPAE